MHEMSIAQDLMRQLEELAEENDIVRVDAVTVRAGVLAGIVPEALDMAFACLAEGTVAEGAELTLEIEPALAECRRCGHRFEPEIDAYLCERCGVADVTILQGRDIILSSLSCTQRGNGNDEDQRGP